MTDRDRFLQLTDLISQEVAADMLERAGRAAKAHGVSDADSILGAMVRHIAAPAYREEDYYPDHTFAEKVCTACGVSLPMACLENPRTSARYTCEQWKTEPPEWFARPNVVHIHSGKAVSIDPDSTS